MEYHNFECEIAEGSARVSIIGPDAPTMADVCDEFIDLMMRLEEDRAVRVILLTDGDHAFDYHHNLDSISAVHNRPEGFEALAADEEVGRRIVTMMHECTKPVVAASRGDIRNLGLNFYLSADIRLASTSASFTAMDMSGGLMPGWGVTHTMTRLIGPGRTLELLMSRRTLSATDAAQIGLVDRVIEDTVWEEQLDIFLERLKSLPQPAVRLTKLGVQQAGALDFTTMLSYEWESQQQCWDSHETAEGMLAWQEGRPPRLEAALGDEED